MTNFVSLHNQTYYSILDSIISPKDLFERAKILGHSACAIVDHGTLAAAWESLKASKETGVKLIIGCECYFQDAPDTEDKFRHIILLAKNAIGYKNLLTINKLGFDQGRLFGKRVYSVIDWKLLEMYAEGLICLTACGNGIISQLLSNGKFDEAEQSLLRLKNIFGENLGVEIQPNNMDRGSNIYSDKIDQKFLNRRLIDLGKKHNIRVVAACNSHYLKKEDAKVHDVFLAIGSHQPIYSNFRLKYPTPEFYLKSGDEVKAFFSRNYGDELAEEFCTNSIHFADLCEIPEWIDPKFSNPSGKELPLFPVKDESNYVEFKQWVELQDDKIRELDEDKSFLRFICFNQFEKYKLKLSEDKHKIYLDRINEEIETLEFHGFSSYMLIVADYVNWCVKNNIPVGPGRGSIGGCFVAFLLGIHKADSIQYGLIFERFHNKEKKSFPDIDQDVSTEHRGEVLNYLKNKYGSDYMCSISNYNTITPKVYARDVSRALEFGGSKEEAVKIGNDLASFISNDASRMTDINKILNDMPLLGEYAKKYPEISEMGSLIGLPRAQSMHAAGICISKRPLVGLVPLRKDKDNSLIIEYDKDLTEENGLVKMDILGLSTLDVVAKIISQIIIEIKKSNKSFNDEHLDYDANDQKTYELICKGDTFGVFQFGTSAGTIDLCKRIKPSNIEDLAIITTLARPAAANIRNDFILAREGKKEFTLLDKSLEGAFKKTYGFGLFDESILQLGRDVAGWSYNDADRIRKMIKDKGKNPEKDKKLKKEFIESAIKNKIPPILAPRIWEEEIAKFASYTFNKSHAIVYSFISYQTAYLKAHFPIEFLMANLMAEVKSNNPDAKLNIAKIKKELRAHKVKIFPPDMNKSQLTYTISENNLLTGLDALKFVGDEAILDIIEKRPFKSFFDFMARVDSRKLRSNAIQALVAAGAMDNFKISRKLIYLYCSDYRKKLQIWLKKHNPDIEEFVYPWPKEPDWKISEIYALEQFYLGESFICKSPVAYNLFFKEKHYAVADIKKSKEKTKVSPIRAIIKDLFEFKVKKEGSKYLGKPMVKAVIEDRNGEQCSCTIFPDTWKEIQDRVKKINSKAKFEIGLAISFSGYSNNYEDNMGIILDTLFDIALPPIPPLDLKAKKVSLRKEKDLPDDPNKQKNLFEELEDSLYEEGLIDLDEEIN